MNYKEIVELIEKVAELGIGELEIEQAGTKIRIQGKPTPAAQMMSPYPAGQHAMPALAPSAAPILQLPAKPEDSEAGLHIINNPSAGDHRAIVRLIAQVR